MVIASTTSMALAATAVILTASVIAGTVTMVIFFEVQTEGVNMTDVPTVPSTTEAPPPIMRLPKTLIPERYEVFIWLHLYPKIVEVANETTPSQTMFYEGTSTVHFRCEQWTKTIFLHSKNQVVSNFAVKEQITNTIRKVDHPIHHTDDSDFLEIKLFDPLLGGHNYTLTLDFEGEISESLQALYLSTYTEGVPAYEGDPSPMRYLSVTDLEPTGARKLFPCFDEPEMKAYFDLTLKYRSDFVAIGNAQVKASQNLMGWETTAFYTTPKMSTYLFAFTVSQLKKDCYDTERVSICIHARPAAIDARHHQYAKDITGKILDFYEKHFQINYRLNKLDQVALPDLNAAAMENWGMLTYQEGGLLYEEGVSSLLHKEVIATLISHELAHQWFGNLVTMKWWNQLWLKEGFATYMSYFAVDHVEPLFGAQDMLIMNDLYTAFEEDALASSHPLSVPQNDIQTSYEIIEMYDAITYSKGAIVLRMLANVVKQRTFDKGINSYLKAFEFKSTDQYDLWDHMQKAVQEDSGNTDVAAMMDTWTNQIGYPVVVIHTTTGLIYQKHFLFNHTAESANLWHIPITVMSNKSVHHSDIEWLTDTAATKDSFKSQEGEWILANINCTGYYRVNYDLNNWHRLLEQLQNEPDRILVKNRGQLIDDTFNLARAKMVSVTLALNFTQFLRNETEYLPWESAIRNLKYFVLMFDRSEVYGPMQLYLRHQVQGLYDFFKNDTDHSRVPESHSSQHNQINAINVACSNGLPECLTMVTEMYGDWMKPNGTNNIHPNLRSVIYCQAVAQGGKKEWEFAWEKFQSSSDTSEKDQLRAALSCTKQTWLLNRYLKYTLDPDKIRLMEVPSTINYIANNPAGQDLAWNFIRAHWDYVSLGDGATLIEGVTRRFATQFELEELKRFATSYKLGSAAAAVHHAIEQTQVNIQWVHEHKDIVLEWFENMEREYAL